MLYSTDNMGGDEFEPADSIRPVPPVPVSRLSKHEIGQSIKLQINRDNDRKAREQYERDHSHVHCFESKKPPCGQKIEHLKCCLCEKLNPVVKEPEAGWETLFEQTFSITDYNQPEAARIKAFIRQQIDKTRDNSYSIEGAAYDSGFKQGKLQALSRIEEEVERMKRNHADYSSSSYICLTEIAAAITKLREEYGINN